jgi:hypothetical protein
MADIVQQSAFACFTVGERMASISDEGGWCVSLEYSLPPKHHEVQILRGDGYAGAAALATS